MTATATEGSELVYATEGTGPLLERDYWAVVEGTGVTPGGAGRRPSASGSRGSPRTETACFRRDGECSGPLEVGDEMDIRIALLGDCRVRVVHVDDQGLTLRTLKGHPEAGRITFGADRDDEGADRLPHPQPDPGERPDELPGLPRPGQADAGALLDPVHRPARRATAAAGSPGRVQVRTRKVVEDAADRAGSRHADLRRPAGG